MKPLLKDPERQKMYEHIVAMFIVTWFLVIALFVVGCKDKAEAKISEPIVCDSGSEFRYNNGRTVLEPNETKFYTTKELDEIFKDEPVLGRLAKDLYGVGEGRIKFIEPNESNEPEEILICPEHYKRYCKICESIVYRGSWLLPFKGSYLYNQALKEKKEIPESMKYSLPIPTWPDYIELEKDLVMYWDAKPPKDPHLLQFEYDREMIWPKGTKIYFKED